MARRIARNITGVLVLALPIVALLGFIGQSEWDLRRGTRVSVPITGYDPQDVLRGHYVRFRIAWRWAEAPPATPPDAICVAHAGDNPPVQPAGAAPCRLRLRGGEAAGSFMPAGITDRLFVPEARAAALQTLLLTAPDALSVELAVLPDGSARLLGWRAATVSGGAAP